MSRERERRLHKVEEVLQKELDKRIAELTEARQQRARAADALRQAIEKIQQASQERLQAALRGSTPEEWSEQHLWDLSLHRKAELAQQHLQESDTQMEQARQALLKARSDVDRVATILKRMQTARQVKEQRDERKTEDESAAVRAAAQAAQWRSVGTKTPER